MFTFANRTLKILMISIQPYIDLKVLFIVSALIQGTYKKGIKYIAKSLKRKRTELCGKAELETHPCTKLRGERHFIFKTFTRPFNTRLV